MILNGRVGQVCGPFSQGEDLLSEDGAISKITPEKTRPILYKLRIEAETGTKVKINDMNIKIGKTGIYELDSIVAIKKLSFLDSNTDENTIVDFVY